MLTDPGIHVWQVQHPKERLQARAVRLAQADDPGPRLHAARDGHLTGGKAALALVSENK